VPAPPSLIQARLRVELRGEIALGPGKVDLLDAIERTGSLAGAAEAMGMSYMRAWKLVRTMNACFREPLVETARGGSARGGAALTEAGREMRDLYREMEAACRQALKPLSRKLKKRLVE
jgi:molybdate transport system regulatory protein